MWKSVARQILDGNENQVGGDRYSPGCILKKAIRSGHCKRLLTMPTLFIFHR
jgi:hypothetical protein